jgi:hypothetical protein
LGDKLSQLLRLEMDLLVIRYLSSLCQLSQLCVIGVK